MKSAATESSGAFRLNAEGTSGMGADGTAVLRASGSDASLRSGRRQGALPKGRRGGKRRKRYLILTAVLLSLLAVTAVVLLRNSAEAKGRAYAQRARESYESADYESALLYLRRAMEGGEDPELLMLMADCYEGMENYSRAMEVLRKLNTADPAIASRIQALEQKRNALSNSEKVTVLGQEYDHATRSLNLDERNLTDAQLVEVTALYALDSLSLRNNRLTDVSPLASLGGLDELDLSGNRIENVDALAGIRGLRSLNLSGNPITECSALKALSNLSSLNLTGTEVGEESLSALAEALPACAIRVTGDDKEATEEILYGNSRFRADATELQLDGMGLREIGALEEFTEVRTLDLSGNEIGDLRPLMLLSKLETLNLAGNEVQDLRPLMGLPKLKKLDVSDNLIVETASVGAIASLEELNLSGNRIGDFSGLGKLTRLTELNLSNTGIQDAALPDFYGLTSLVRLNLQDNSGLSDRAVGTLKAAISGCSVLTSELVYEVEFAGHTVRSDEKHLAFPAGGISDLTGLSRLNRLEELDLSHNEITSLYAFQVCACRETLKTLNLSGNRISDVSPLNALTALEELNLSDNLIEITVGLERMTALKRLNLSGNPVLEAQLSALRAALPDCEIVFGG